MARRADPTPSDRPHTGPCPKCKGWVEAAAIGGSVPVDALAAPAKPVLLTFDAVEPKTRVVGVLVECNCGYGRGAPCETPATHR
jgi:hypothetical protein